MRYWSTRSGDGGSSCSSTGKRARRFSGAGAIRGTSQWLALLAMVILSNWCLCAATLTWEPSAGASAYRVYHAVGLNPFSLVAVTTNTTATVTVAPDETNRWTVTATNLFARTPADGESDLSNVVTLLPSPPIPPPTRLMIASVQGIHLNLSWVPGDPSYSTRVERAPVGGAFVVIATVAPGTSQFSTVARKNDSWSYRVRSCDGTTCSGPSATVVWVAR